MNLRSLRTPAMVLACGSIILSIGFGVRASFGLFLQPMSLEFGWGREVFSIAMAIQNLLWGALSAFAGGLADRYGAGRVVAICGALYVLGLVAMAFSDTPLTLYLGSGVLIGLALSGATFGVVLAVIARVAAPEKRSTALGIATAAGSFGQFALLPVAQLFISRFDWQMALVGLAAITALIVPLAFTQAGRPAPAALGSQSLRGALGEAMRDRSFHLLFWGFFVCGFQLLMFTVHLPAFVTDQGLKPEHGMTALALIGLFNTIGSFVSGWLGGRFSKKYLLAAIYVLRGLLILFLISFPLTPTTLYTFAIGMGLLWLSTVPLTNGLVGQIFGLRYMATLTGVVFFGHQIGSFTGIWLAGYLYDTTGSYTGAMAISIGLGVFAALVNIPVNEKPLSERRPIPAPA
ncbi:MAG: MFS transporter [Betaproteobacteria bacterium RIFCSPHIGHO2_12_FULL_69_13]|nr:MAG: MFS transporter [Betaproteobacteria bacterium RIFCSPHIGHO2_12_FULL_69_13]OGA68571.1 MAG: MFS transporter [Betaproteobacteria bacterium RIFCSPLOWO2_12_FULL_68_20]